MKSRFDLALLDPEFHHDFLAILHRQTHFHALTTLSAQSIDGFGRQDLPQEAAPGYRPFRPEDDGAGDVLRVDWLNPSGTVAKTLGFNPVSSAGSWCFDAWLSKASDPLTPAAGTWTVRITWNSSTLTSLQFPITSSGGGGGGTSQVSVSPSSLTLTSSSAGATRSVSDAGG